MVAAAPFTAGASLAAAGGAAFMTGWFAGAGAGIYAVGNQFIGIDIDGTQKALDEDVRETNLLNRTLTDAGRNERVDTRDLVFNIREKTPPPDQLRQIASKLEYGKSKADMIQLLQTL